MATATAPVGALRVAAVWGTTVVELRTLRKGESFQLDDSPNAAYAMPDGVEMSKMPLFFARGGWELDARGAKGGALRLRGRDEDPAAIASSGAPIAVVPGDYGLLQYGLFSIFFQYTTMAPPVSGGIPIELLVLLALFSSAVLHGSFLGILRLTMTPDPLPKPLELTNPDELAARFGLHRAEVEIPPPPTDVAEKPGGSGVKDPGANDKKPTGGGQKIAGAEGKLGMQGKADKTEISGAPQPAPNLGGLSDVLNSDTGEEIKRTLTTINSVAAALNGLNSSNIVLGMGSGTGLKGGGPGGGGERRRGRVRRRHTADRVGRGQRRRLRRRRRWAGRRRGRRLWQRRQRRRNGRGRWQRRRHEGVARRLRQPGAVVGRRALGRADSSCGEGARRGAPRLLRERSAAKPEPQRRRDGRVADRRDRDGQQRVPLGVDVEQPTRRRVRRSPGEGLALPDERCADERGELPVPVRGRRVGTVRRGPRASSWAQPPFNLSATAAAMSCPLCCAFLASSSAPWTAF